MNENIYPLDKSININWVKVMTHKERNTQYMKPLIETPISEKVKGTLVEVVNSIKKRNLNPPILTLPRDPKLVDEVVDTFIETYINKERLTEALKANDYNSDIYFEDWLRKKTGAQMNTMEASEFKMHNPNQFHSHLKPDHKPKIENTINKELPGGQIVAAHHPMVTAYCAPIIKCFTLILKQSLKHKWKINDGLTNEEMNGHINHVLKDAKEIIPHEVDFSKFDKSQDEFLLMVQLEIFRRFKVPTNFINFWKECHTYTTLVFHSFGIVIKTKYQRKSGDVMTFLGNSIVTMAVLAYTHNYIEAFGGIFGGDDALIFLKASANVTDQSRHIAEMFNLTSKIEIFPDAMYFSSKFLINTQGTWQFVPDPMKAVLKLGKRDFYCLEHIKLYHESFKDAYKSYQNITTRRLLSEVALKRYKKKFKNSINSLRNLIEFLQI